MQHLAQGLVQLADVAEAEPPQEPPGGLGRGDREASHRLLCPVPPGNIQVVEALGPQSQGLGHAEDGLGLGQPPVSDLEVQLGVDRRAEPDRIRSRPQQNCSGVGGDIPVCGGKLDFGRAPGYSHLASASCARETGWLRNPIFPAQEAFSLDFRACILSLLMVLSI